MTINEAWEISALHIPEGLTEAETELLKSGFYGGASAMLRVLSDCESLREVAAATALARHQISVYLNDDETAKQ